MQKKKNRCDHSLENFDSDYRAPGHRTPTPRLLTREQAAAYCGMGGESFKANCPVQPIRVRAGLRGLRYDLHDLNDWIDQKKSENGDNNSISMLEKLGHV